MKNFRFLVFLLSSLVILMMASTMAMAVGTIKDTIISNGQATDSTTYGGLEFISTETASVGASSPATTAVIQGFDVSSSIPVDQGATGADTTVWISYTLTNAGNGSDNFALSAAVTSFTGTGTGWATAVYDNAKSGTINESGSLNADASFNFYVSIEVPSNAVSGDTATVALEVKGNNKSGTSDSWGVGLDTKSDSTITTVGGAPNIIMTIVANKTSVLPDDPGATGEDTSKITYTITFNNTGTAGATNVVVKNKIPQYTSFVTDSLSSTVGTSSESGGLVTVTAGTLNAGATGSFTYTVLVQ